MAWPPPSYSLHNELQSHESLRPLTYGFLSHPPHPSLSRPREDGHDRQSGQPTRQHRTNERPYSRQQLYERPPSQQAYERPPSRQQEFGRPSSRQDGYDPPSNHQVSDRPPSRQHLYDRPSSRQQSYDRPPSRQQPYDRPSSRQQSDQSRSRHFSERNGRSQSASEAARRTFLKGIADTTIAAINKGIPGVDVTSTQRNTRLYREDSTELKNWNSQSRSMFAGTSQPTEINIMPMSTLKGARFLYELDPSKKIGVLNFASATKPGGGFLSGARAQEESIARSSTLYVSLTTAAARPFYAIHDQDDKRGFYTHSMIYSPDVHLFRDDDGAFLTPVKVDVVTSPAVNAGQVRRLGRRTPAQIEAQIQEVMRERMGRILALFEKKRARCLVLGSFGTGVFQNDVRAMAAIWYDLLRAPGARFAGSFQHVIFAIPDDNTSKQFGSVFSPGPRQDGARRNL